MNCKKCGRKMHACSNCYFTTNWEWHYCCESCWQGSDEYVEVHAKLIELRSSLNEQQEELFKFLAEWAFYNDDFIQLLWEVIKGQKC